VAIRWLLQKENVPSVVIGVKTLDQLTDNFGVNSWKLSDEDMKTLDEASAVPLAYPYEMIERIGKGRKRKNCFQ
jgi:aryl-alcohol dehydrogenase-like predicted oxidoreductase